MSRPVAAFLVLLGLAGGCRPQGGDRPQAREDAPQVWPTWEGFDAYPGARELCGQRVYVAGQTPAHITWRAYVSASSPQAVIAFYEGRHHALRASDVKEWFSLRGREGQTLSVHDPAIPGYPTCDRRPGVGDQSVIIVAGPYPGDGSPAPERPR